MFSRQGLRQTWKDVRPYLVFSVILFFASIVVGGTPNGSADWLRAQLEGIGRIAEKARSSDNPQLSFFWLIFFNNVVKSVMAMYLGIAAAVVPVVMLVANGMILGFVFGGYADQGGNVWLLLVKGILPHGILELPAFFLACAIGVRLGVHVWKGIFASLLGKTEPWAAFKRTLSGSVPVLVLVSVMLLVAAIVESTVTYRLVS